MAAETLDWTGHVIVCGLREVGLRVIEQLRTCGVPVVIVDDEPERRLVHQVEVWAMPFIRASAKLPESLADAGLPGALAVIVAESRELDTLEVTLLIRQTRPDIRIVVSMANESVGRALASLPGDQQVLNVAELAAPSLVQACLQDPLHELEIPGARFVAARTQAPRLGRLRELYGNLAPVGVIDAETGQTVVCPGRDQAVRGGDTVLLIGTETELTAADVRIHRQWSNQSVDPRLQSLRKVRRITRSVVAEADGALRGALVAAIVLVLACATVLWRFYDTHGQGRLEPLHAVYFALATVVTVGFGDYNFGAQNDAMVTFGIFMIIAGALTFTTLVALLTNLLVSRQLASSMGRAEAARLSGHIVIVGLGAIGVRVAKGLLDAGRDVVIVERDENNRFMDQARGLGVPVVIGDATLPGTLLAAGLAKARAVALLTSDDLVNIEAGIVTRDLLGNREATTPIVMRVFDRTLGSTLRKAFNFNYVRSTAELTAPWFVGAALGLDVLGSVPLGREQLVLGRLKVAKGDGLDGVAMGELSSRTRVVALQRLTGELLHPPRRDTRFGPGDEAYIVGPPVDVIGVLRR